MQKKRLGIPVIALTTLGLSAPALAGSFGSILYGPGARAVAADIGAQGIPLLGGFGLMVLSALLALVSVKVMKDKHRGGGTWLLVASLTAALSTAGGGIKLISDAQAGVPSLPIELTNDSGGEVEIPGPGFWQVLNSSSVPQRILNVEIVPSDCYLFVPGILSNGGNGGSVGMCSVGSTELEPTQACDIEVYCCLNGGRPNGGDNGGLNGGIPQGGAPCVPI